MLFLTLAGLPSAQVEVTKYIQYIKKKKKTLKEEVVLLPIRQGDREANTPRFNQLK